MEKLFNNLLLYEVVLMFLGVFLFMLLSAALVYFIIKKRAIKGLLFFFAIPILMIGYPSIQQITISADKIDLSKYQQAYIENPNDSIAKQKLENLSEKLEKRAEIPEDILQISKTKLLLGKPEEAIIYANKAIEKQNSANSGNESVIVTDTINNPPRMIYSQAAQLKELAQFQNKITVESDSATISAKLGNLEVNENLKGTKAIVRRNALQTISRKEN